MNFSRPVPAGQSSTRLHVGDWLLLAVLAAAFMVQRYDVLSSDPLLAWPITDSIAHPGRYSLEDLLVQAGASGNFLLYRLLAYFPFLQDNYPLRDFLFFIPLLFLLLVAWWKVFLQIGATRPMAALATMLVLFSDDKLSINWAHVVPPYFISASSVQFAQVFGLLWFLQGRRVLALAVTALTGYFHPATALSFGAVYAFMLGLDAYRARNWRELVPAFVFAAIFLPAALLIALNSQGAFAATQEYFSAFERYQPQAYLGDHFRMGYAYTLAVAAFVYAYFQREQRGLRNGEEVFRFIGIGLALSLAWFANLYITHNLQFVHTFFVMRIFTLLKPLLIVLMVMAATSMYESASTLPARILALAFLVSPLGEFSPPLALVIVVCAAMYASGRRWWLPVSALLAAGFFAMLMWVYRIGPWETLGYLRNLGPGRPGNELNAFQAALLLVCLVLVARKSWPHRQPVPMHLAVRYAMLAFLATYVAYTSEATLFARLRQGHSALFDFEPANYWGVRSSDRAYAELIDWTRQSPERLFAVPPYDDRFLSFRYLAGKGVYIFHRDVAQLMYSPSYYLSGISRLERMGGSSPELPKAFMTGEVRRSNGDYETRCREMVASDAFDAVVLERRRVRRSDCPEVEPLFANARYIVYRTTGARRVPN